MRLLEQQYRISKRLMMLMPVKKARMPPETDLNSLSNCPKIL
jgi:hypothetical protein